MTQDVKFVILVTLLLGHKKCGKWPYLFATIVANTKILLDIVDLDDNIYRAFHGFGHAKFLDGGLVLGMSQFSILPQLPPKILFNSKLVKIDPKIIILLC